MSKQEIQTRPPQGIVTFLETPKWKEEVMKVIPKEIVIDALLRVARSVASDQKFAQTDPRSFLQALLKCGRAGLYPDGREAHLIAFGKEVQAIFDVKGICALAGRAGILVTPKLVHEGDEFQVDEDDGTGKTRVIHRADYRKPRGEIQAVYSRAVLPNGQVDYEIMTAEEVEAVRQHYSKAKDSTPWKRSWGEMAKKTAIKRHSKRWDMSPEIRMAMNGDDDALPQAGEAPKITKPLFEAKVEAPPPEPPPVVPITAVDIKDLCVRDGIKESDLLEFAMTIALCEEGCKSVDKLSSEAIFTIFDQWGDFSTRIKEAIENQ